jgi:hypothetical protein
MWVTAEWPQSKARLRFNIVCGNYILTQTLIPKTYNLITDQLPSHRLVESQRYTATVLDIKYREKYAAAKGRREILI